jgi:hypothetical protein
VKGANSRVAAPAAGGLGRSATVAFSLLYLAFRALLGAQVRSRRGLDVKDVELLILRHELEVLRTLLRWHRALVRGTSRLKNARHGAAAGTGRSALGSSSDRR